MWKSMKRIVKNETGVDLKADKIDDYTKAILRNICYWMIGSNDGEWDPSKSLYITGGLGVGKTTVVMAMNMVLNFFRMRLDWSFKYLNFQSMERLFLETMAGQELKIISRFSSGGWILDDIKPEMYLINFYGQEVQLINRILHARHEVWKYNGKQTIITSNVPWVKFCDATHLNDARLVDRLSQQYIPVTFEGKNKRSPATRLKHQKNGSNNHGSIAKRKYKPGQCEKHGSRWNCTSPDSA